MLKCRNKKYSTWSSVSLLLLVGVFGHANIGVSRDGTLPAFLNGVVLGSSPGANKGLTINFDDRVHGNPIHTDLCKLKGDKVATDHAAGSLEVEDKTYKIVGICKDAVTKKYEVVAEGAQSRVNLVGSVANTNTGVDYKGTVVVKERSNSQNAQFQLKE